MPVYFESTFTTHFAHIDFRFSIFPNCFIELTPNYFTAITTQRVADMRAKTSESVSPEVYRGSNLCLHLLEDIPCFLTP